MRNLLFSSSLELEINVIGYKNQGECILFFIKTDGNAAYTGLVDCYKNNDSDVIRELLEQEKVNKFDFVCWTHPHDDHTKGLEEVIIEFCDETTKFWTTDIIPKDYDLYSAESRQVYQKLKEIHLSGNTEKIKIKYAKNSTIMDELICSGLEKYAFQIRSFAPDSTSLAEREVANKDEEGNLCSIGLFINIGRYYIMLAGDVENSTFKSIDDFEIEKPVDYIKIPHHGSPSASFLVDRMSALDILPPNVVTTTLYRKGRIPKRKVLNKYSTWGVENIISAGDIDCKENDIYPYGLIKTTFDILEQKEYQIETALVGNAVIVK